MPPLNSFLHGSVIEPMHHSDFLNFLRCFLSVWVSQRACAIFTCHVSVGRVASAVAGAYSLGDELECVENWPAVYSDAPRCTFVEDFLLDWTQIS